MGKKLAVLAFWLAAAPLYAVTSGMEALTTGATDDKPHTARFAIGLTVDGGQSWQTSALLNQKITLKGSFDPDANHVGQKADVFVVDSYNGKMSMLTATGTWLPWSGKVGELKPVLDDAVLRTSQEVTIHQGGISTAGQHKLYIGYALATAGSPLIYSTSPATLNIAAAVTDAATWFKQEIFADIVMQKCTLCHVDGGVAKGSSLHFIKDANLAQQNYDAFASFYKQLGSGGYSYVLGKVSGGNGHAGGNQLPLGSIGYQELAVLLDLLDGGGTVTTRNALSLFDGVAMQSSTDTLRDASLLFAGRLPTVAETAAVANGGEAALKTVLIAMMQGEHFHKFLKDGADDRLFLRGNEDLNLADDCPTCFPQLNAQYWALKDQADTSGSAVDRGLLNMFMSQLNYSLLEAPLELIAYVVEQNKPYSEILTADYDMMTLVLNGVVGGTATFPAGASRTEFAPGRVTDYRLRDPGTVVQAVPGAAIPRLVVAPKLVAEYPHVGLLTSKSFLSRYPSTATNRNRARARWTYYNFLGVDIEALAKRSTDPVALADTNNPTMNNPACTVCHSVLDPVAGTFQLFNDNGNWKSALNGTDSLDPNYKSTRTQPRLYVAGDTWYRDMRTPGFEGATASGDSLRWLAQQIVKDRRFASAAVKFWWPAVIGSELLNAPEATEDANYAAKLAAYEAQQATINTLTDRFIQSGLSVKDLLSELVLTPWFRASQNAAQVTAAQSSARALALVSGEKLLTPEALGRKTQALTGFNWNAQTNATTGAQVSGLENDYSTFYGGIDGFALKTRSRSLTPMMSNVAVTHAMESACPIVLGDFIRPDAQRLLFDNFSPWLTPLTQQSVTQTITSTSETDFKSYTFKVDLTPGTHQLAVSLLNDACDYSSSPSTCRSDKNLVINTLSVQKPNGQTLTVNGNAGTFGSCAAVTNTTRATLYASCSAVYNYTADQQGSYTFTASLAAKQQANDPVIAGLNVESTAPAATAATPGAALIKQKLVELHGRLLGQNVTATSPEVLASYDLLVQTWQGRKAANSTPSLLQSKALACDWSTDIGFISTLGYPGNPLGTNGRYSTTAVTNWLLPQAQDVLWMKQSWVVVMAYMLSHYDYLHE